MRRGGSGGQTPFARAYMPWVDAWAAAGLSATQVFVLLKLASRMQFGADGVPRAWYPRAEMARELGLSEGTVSNAILRLRKLGFLEAEQAGHSGRATVYRLMPDCPVNRAEKVHSMEVPNDQKGSQNRAEKVHSMEVPLRSKEIGRGHEAAPPKRGQGCDVDARGALDAPAQRVKSGAEFLAEYLGEGVEHGG